MIRKALTRLRNSLDARKVTQIPGGCVVCGGPSAIAGIEGARADFDRKVLSVELRRVFLRKHNGHCLSCGAFQDLLRPTRDQIVEINALGKDELSSQQEFKGKGPSLEFIEKFNSLYFSRRLEKWRDATSTFKKIENALILRSWFGATAQFAMDYLGAKSIDALDVSAMCRNYLHSNKDIKFLDGEISGVLEGDFLGRRYDAILVFHCLTHALAPSDYLSRLVSILNPQGFVIFSHEVERKPLNPFHFNHFHEIHLSAVLKKHFSSVTRVDDCQEQYIPHVNEYTIKGDCPDFLCRP